MKEADCDLDCPVRSTCGVYIGLTIITDPRTNKVVSCNRRDFYVNGAGLNE